MAFDQSDSSEPNGIHSPMPTEHNETTPLLESASMPQETVFKASPWNIIVPMFLWAIVMSSSVASLLQFFTEIYCDRYYQSNSGGLGGGLNDDNTIPIKDCAVPEVQSAVSKALAIITFLNFFCALFMSGYFGRLSDRKGRTFIVRLSILGSVLGLVCLVITGKYQKTFGVTLLFVSPIIRGLMAGETTLMAATQAYITDTTTPSERTLIFGRMMASVYLGATIGPTLGSFIIKETGDIYYVIYFSIIAYSLIGFYTLFMPESNVLKEDDAVENGTQKYTPFWDKINIFSALTILMRTHTQHSSRYALPIVAAINTVLTIITAPPFLLYAMLKFGWGAYEGGLFISMFSFIRLSILIGFLPFLHFLFKKWCQKTIVDGPNGETSAESEEKKIHHTVMFDIWMIRSGALIEVTGLTLIGLAATALGFTSTAFFHSFSLITQPSIRSLLISFVKPSEVGELFGAIAALEAFAVMFAQISINALYSASVTTMPNLVFFVCAGFAGLASLMTFLVHPVKKEEDAETTSKK
ncbi:major facilitator superfamily domain-containing protein [Phycomyces nitens]|nr:major facilitator superfamily domain-containing protein [Phycomyces nitens]